MTGGWGWRVTQHGVMTGGRGEELPCYCTAGGSIVVRWLVSLRVWGYIHLLTKPMHFWKTYIHVGLFSVTGDFRIYTDYMLKGDLIQVVSPQSLTVWGRGYTIGTPLINISYMSLFLSLMVWGYTDYILKGTSYSISWITDDVWVKVLQKLHHFIGILSCGLIDYITNA